MHFYFGSTETEFFEDWVAVGQKKTYAVMQFWYRQTESLGDDASKLQKRDREW